jgi:hypothetical protein
MSAHGNEATTSRKLDEEIYEPETERMSRTPCYMLHHKLN